MIRQCDEPDFNQIWSIINDGAQAYQGIIPADRLANPYMPESKLREEIADGVTFYGEEVNGTLAGVMGIQPVAEVTLIRHAYVRTRFQSAGIGGRLLTHLRSMTDTPILIGTWADASWAIRFYQRHGFHVVDPQVKDRLLRKYWKVPERQIETSVVLADRPWPDTA